MSSFKMVLWASAVGWLWGCAGKTVPPSPLSAHGHAEGEARRDGERHSRDAPVAEDIESAVALLVARCNAVELAPDTPVACQVDVVDDVARMRLTMANQVAARRYLARTWRELARPFCDLANQDAAGAGIVVSLYEEREMQVVDCLSGRLSDWQPLARGAR